MPIRCKGGGKPRYRVRRLKGGKKQRLAFCGSDVVETKDLSTGVTEKITKKAKKRKRRY